MAIILIVDDDPTICQMLCDVVADLGHSWLCASDGRAALQLVRAHRPHLVLSDVMMPILDGYGLVAAIRTEPTLAQVLIVLMSAAFQQGQNSGLAVEVNGFLAKPFQLPEIEQLLERFNL